jgi:hypothetical protein
MQHANILLLAIFQRILPFYGTCCTELDVQTASNSPCSVPALLLLLLLSYHPS